MLELIHEPAEAGILLLASECLLRDIHLIDDAVLHGLAHAYGSHHPASPGGLAELVLQYLLADKALANTMLQCQCHITHALGAQDLCGLQG